MEKFVKVLFIFLFESFSFPLRALSSGVPNAKYLAFGTPNTKNHPSSALPNLKKFETWLQLRRYGDKCQTLFGLFNSFVLSPPIRCLSVYISCSLCVAFLPRRSCHRRSRHADLATLRDRDRSGSPLITDPLYDEEQLQCEGHDGRK